MGVPALQPNIAEAMCLGVWRLSLAQSLERVCRFHHPK
jgi:hypothetical protein